MGEEASFQRRRSALGCCCCCSHLLAGAVGGEVAAASPNLLARAVSRWEELIIQRLRGEDLVHACSCRGAARESAESARVQASVWSAASAVVPSCAAQRGRRVKKGRRQGAPRSPLKVRWPAKEGARGIMLGPCSDPGTEGV